MYLSFRTQTDSRQNTDRRRTVYLTLFWSFHKDTMTPSSLPKQLSTEHRQTADRQTDRQTADRLQTLYLTLFWSFHKDTTTPSNLPKQFFTKHSPVLSNLFNISTSVTKEEGLSFLLHCLVFLFFCCFVCFSFSCLFYFASD